MKILTMILGIILMNNGWCIADDNIYHNGQYDDNFEQNDDYFDGVLDAKNSANDNYFQNEHEYGSVHLNQNNNNKNNNNRNKNKNNIYSLRNRLMEDNDDQQHHNEYVPRDDRRNANNYEIPFTFTNYRKQQQQQQQQRHYEDDIKYTQDISVKQGKLRGFVREMHPQSGLKNVDQYLGIPYAEAPVGSRRFMPPGAPPPWNGVKIATKLPAVCPQLLPNLGNADHKPSKGRYDQIKRLIPYLMDESEDCLFMNIYVPAWEGVGPQAKYSVIVYIHGESFEWNSGNPYDGSILASYGQVIVITLNYRLGILGFMKPGISDHTVSNFGLLDQVAALQWIKDNIGAFSGDNKAITLMGHGTGAACVNFLMVSPVAKGLFHRSILMSGSALSDWALTNHPLQATMQIAEGLNCPLSDENEEMLQCLRKKRYSEIFSVKTSSPEFSTRFGPIIDGLVIPNTAHKVMGQYSDIFSRYDLLYGLTELESYHILNAIAHHHGLLENERDNLLRFYMQNRFEIRPDLAFASTLKEYTDIYIDPSKAVASDHRDKLLEILSDARVAAPLVQTGLYLAKVNPKCYMYVFSHNSEAGEYARLAQSVVGEELAFVFGAPLGQVGPFQPHYNADERLFSEAIMKYWTNFAKTGNPKAPWRDLFLNQNPKDWEHYDVDWPEFNSINQSYLHLGITPVVAYRYRHKYMRFWNQDLPDELTKLTTMKNIPPFFLDKYNPNGGGYTSRGTSTNPDMITGHINLYPIKVDIERPEAEDLYRTIKTKLKDPLTGPGMYNAPAQPAGGYTPPMNADSSGIFNYKDPNEADQEIAKAESTMTVLICLIIFFLLINIVIIVGYLVKRNMNKGKESTEDNIIDGVTDEKRSKFNETDDSFIMDIVRKTNNTYEPVKAQHSPINGYKMTRQLSTSTVDAHTKVCDWISQEIVKYSPKPDTKKFHSPIMSIKGRSFLQKPKKVSVAIDATPSARSNSILRQEPIEITKAKSMDYPLNKDVIICQDVEVSDIDSVNTFEMDQENDSESLSYPCNEPFVNIYHAHSKSDPVDTYALHPDEEITSFIEPDDINVTSRDSSSASDSSMSPEEALKTIQRRNFPKVLPDHPNTTRNNAMKRRSLPPQYIVVPPTNSLTRDFGFRLPPQPPPRTSSTLGRNTNANRSSNNFFTSPIMVAEEPPSKEEPVITLNTLHVGPIVPKNQDYASQQKNNTNPQYKSYNEKTHQEGVSKAAESQPDNVDDSGAVAKTKKKTGIPLPGSYKVPALHEDINEKRVTKASDASTTKTPPTTPTTTIAPTVAAVESNSSKIPTREKHKLTTKDRDKSSSDSSSTVSSTGTVRKIK